MRLRRFRVGERVWVTPLYVAISGVVVARKGIGWYVVAYGNDNRLTRAADICSRKGES